MKLVIQRVLDASVEVNQEIVGSIQEGLLILVGIEEGDTLGDVFLAARKVSKLRIFDDENGVMNRSILDSQGSILSISQFTLAADVRKGNRPSYINAMNAHDADAFYNIFNEALRKENIIVETGVFQTHMNVRLNNDGPVTIIIQIQDGKIITI